jgi:uncharacterized protein YjbI with pentapeptide repeats
MSELRARWDKLMGWRPQLDRPYKLLAVFVTTIVTVAVIERLANAEDMHWIRDWVKSSKIYGSLFFPEQVSIEWKDRLQGLVLLLGLPVAYCLWHWRDKNVRDQIENERKDINLKEFQEVQLRAAGALDVNVPREARLQLQIAALQQLRGFMRGEYGEAFRRPAFELIMSGHALAMDKVGVKSCVDASLQSAKKGCEIAEVQKTVEHVRQHLDPVTKMRIWIIMDEWETIRESGFPLDHRNFDLVDLQEKDLSQLTLYHSTFNGARLGCAYIEDSKFWNVEAHGANFGGCSFKNAFATSSNFRGSNFALSEFENCHLERSNFADCILENATFIGAQIEDARFYRCTLDGMRLEENDANSVNSDFLRGVVAAVLPYADGPNKFEELRSQNFKATIEHVLHDLPLPNKLSPQQLDATLKAARSNLR